METSSHAQTREIVIISPGLAGKDLEKIGGKGMGLFRLVRVGARVPRCVCIPCGSEITGAVKEALDYFNDPGASGNYAVRSSASIEDGRARSYAGLFRSFLNVSGLGEIVEAVENCRKSGIAGSVYGEMEGGSPAVSVIVQEMVSPDTAGVLFTCDPVSGSRNHVILEGVQGLGEDLLSGRAEGCRLTTDTEGHIIERSGPFTLENETIGEIVRQALELERRIEAAGLEGPLDFEWAIKDGQIFWLQMRPITAAGGAGGKGKEICFLEPGQKPPMEDGEELWTSMNAREAAPGVLTPLSQDLLLDMVKQGFEQTFLTLGGSLEMLQSCDTVRAFDGRAFLGMTGLKKMMSFLPVVNSDVMIDAILTGKSGEHPQPKFSLGALATLFNIFLKEASLKSDYEKFRKKELETNSYPGRDELEHMKEREIWDRISRLKCFRDTFILHVIGSSRYMTFYSLISKFLFEYSVEPSSLLQGVGTLPFASSAAAMRDLAQAAGPAREILFDAALKPVPHWRKIMESAPSLVEFKGLFKRYIDEYGHLGSGTIDLAAKNWRDEPGRVLELAGELMASGEAHGGKAYLALLTNKRNKIVESLSKRLSFFHRLKLRLLLGLMVEAAPFRENVKFYMFRRIGIIRVLLLEAARRLKEKGLLCSEEDIFFLKSDELKDLLTAKSSSFSPGEISRRRGEHWRNLRMACPIFRVEGGKGARLYFASPARGKREFQGVAASAGAVAGKARVILALEEAGRLRPGEILVTMTTDPSWTPLFSVASGVVVEVGSILSHGAVVAREIGIPAVMGLPGIVSAVRDGDSLFVDGSTGMVRWIQDSEESGVENSRG